MSFLHLVISINKVPHAFSRPDGSCLVYFFECCSYNFKMIFAAHMIFLLDTCWLRMGSFLSLAPPCFSSHSGSSLVNTCSLPCDTSASLPSHAKLSLASFSLKTNSYADPVQTRHVQWNLPKFPLDLTSPFTAFCPLYYKFLCAWLLF